MLDDPDSASIRARIRSLLADRLGIEVSDSSTDLLEAGLMDSLALVNLIVALEETFGRALPLDDFDVDRFRSVDAMAEFLAEAGVEDSPGSAA